jgi:penicillin-binding protein 2
MEAGISGKALKQSEVFKFKMWFKKIKKKRSDENELFAIREGEFGHLDNFSYRLEWTEDSFISSGRAKETIGKTFNFFKVSVITYVFIFFFFLIIGRVAWLQIVKGNYYYSMAEGNRVRVERIEAKRGIIYDSNRRVLSRNVANFLLYFIPADLSAELGKREEIFNEVSRILGDRPVFEIKKEVNKIKPKSLESYQPLFIADNIPYEKAMLLYLKSAEWPGVVLTNKSRREYDLASQSLSHIVGYTGKISPEELKRGSGEYSPIDYIGKMGIEYFWEPDLRGTNGKKEIEVDALGKEKKVMNETKPEDGNNLVLSINAELQKKIEEEILNAFSNSKLRFKKGVVVAMDPQSGEILSLVSLPAYDSNAFARGMTADEYNHLLNQPDHLLFNRAVSGEYPSGSTIKPVIASAALEEGIINENTAILSAGGIRIGEWFFPDWKAGGHGQTNVRRAIAESINTFFYYIGGGFGDFNGLGIDKIVQYAKLFGLGSQLGIDLPAEATGFLPTKDWKEKIKGERWYIGDTYHFAIGQGDVLVTPLQVAAYTSVFANGGKLYRPHLVKEILSASDDLIKKIDEPPIRDNFISERNLKIVREGMRETITAGSASSLGDLPVAVAGKTGTAQWSTKENPHAWFTCFAPYDNPQIVLTILIEEGGEGSSTAVPIAKEVLKWYFKDNKNTNN